MARQRRTARHIQRQTERKRGSQGDARISTQRRGSSTCWFSSHSQAAPRRSLLPLNAEQCGPSVPTLSAALCNVDVAMPFRPAGPSDRGILAEEPGRPPLLASLDVCSSSGAQT